MTHASAQTVGIKIMHGVRIWKRRNAVLPDASTERPSSPKKYDVLNSPVLPTDIIYGSLHSVTLANLDFIFSALGVLQLRYQIGN